MRPRTFILFILVLLVGGLALVLWFVNNSGNNLLSSISSGNGETAVSGEGDGSTQEASEPLPTSTPAIRFQDVVVAKTHLPVGTKITSALLAVERRPETNIALQGGYTFADPADLIDQIVKVDVVSGDAILRPMLALNPTDLSSLGSDLALYVDQGRVAVAMPINRYSGAAYAMRSGDLVDVLMSVNVVQLDEEFNTILPNQTARIDETALSESRSFLLPAQMEGRLEFNEELGLVGEIAPGQAAAANIFSSVQIPRRITQLTVQQAKVLWVGTWQTEQARRPAPQTTTDAFGQTAVAPVEQPISTRLENEPDIVILSMSAQDALSVKWALDRGLDVDLVLRAQGDNNVFVTASVSLPQLVDSGRIAIPESLGFDAAPRADQLFPPTVPLIPPR